MLPADGARLAPDVRARRSRRDPHRRHGGGRRDRRARRLGARLARGRVPDRRGGRHPGRDLLRLPPLPRSPFVRSALFSTPRPMPGPALPALGSALVLGLALPVFVVAGWRVAGWAIAAVLWVAVHAVELLLTRLRTRVSNLAASGVQAFGMFFNALGLLVGLVATAASDPKPALAAAPSYALAYTFELGLSLLAYFGSPA